MRLCLFVLLAWLAVTPIQAEHSTTPPVLIGKINFPTSANKASEKFFIDGVLYLHSFEYDLARAAFQQAQQKDPHFALAYWGEAMTYNHPVWNEQDLDAARKVLLKLGAQDTQRVNQARTAKEKGLIRAIDALYGKGSKVERDAAYAEIMGQLYRQFPNDNEIAAFYALSLLGSSEGERNHESYMQAAGVAEDIYSRNPQHPGALHYAIHSYDDPIHAPLGLRAARIYAKIAPNASHALHMPSHIFLALGMWDDVIASNKAAWAAGEKNNDKHDPKKYTIHDLHALQWLSYAYLQKKQYNQAYQLTKTMEKITKASETAMAKYYYALMRAAYLSETQNWQANLKPFDMNELELNSRASDIYTNATLALSKHESIKPAIAELEKITHTSATHDDEPGHHHTDQFCAITPTGLTMAKVTKLQLQALASFQQGKFTQAIPILQQAIKLEDELPVGYGPPIPVKPSYELLGDMLFKNKQYVEAYKAYADELKRAPNRTLSVEGLKKSKEKIKEHGLTVPFELRPYFNRLMLN